MAFPRFSKTVWAVICGIVLLLGFGATVIEIEDRYAKATEVEAEIREMEKETVETFEAFQMKQQTVNDAMHLQILDMEYENYTDRYYDLKGKLKEAPEDTELQEELEAIKERRKELKDKKEKIMEEIGSVN